MHDIFSWVSIFGKIPYLYSCQSLWQESVNNLNIKALQVTTASHVLLLWQIWSLYLSFRLRCIHCKIAQKCHKVDISKKSSKILFAVNLNMLYCSRKKRTCSFKCTFFFYSAWRFDSEWELSIKPIFNDIPSYIHPPHVEKKIFCQFSIAHVKEHEFLGTCVNSGCFRT